jgi:hypothetical protein
MSNNARIACHEFATELWLLGSGEMPKDKQDFWQRHLQDCSHCQKILAMAQAVQTQYASLPLHEAPERLVRSLAHQAKLQKENVGWLERISRWFSTLSWRYDFKPRRVIAGVALAALLLVFFHQLAFRPKVQHTWEARTFDQKVNDWWNALGQYEAGLSEDEWGFDGWKASASSSAFDERVSDLRESISTMSSELSRAKL